MNSRKIMNEIFRVTEVRPTHPTTVDDEINSAQSIFNPPRQANGTPSTDPRVKKAQDQLNTARPTVKRESANNQAVTVQLTHDEIEAILYCIDYANEKDDDGIRSSEPEAVARNNALDGAEPKLRQAAGTQ